MWSDKNKKVVPVKEEEEDDEVAEKIEPVVVVKEKAAPAKKEDVDDQDDKKTIVKDDGSKATAELRKQRLSFLTNLSSKVLTSTDKPFLYPELFHIIVYYKQDKVYKEEKVELYGGKYNFRAKSYAEAVEQFASLVSPIAEKDNDIEFGLIGNKRLLLTTSAFKAHIAKQGDSKFVGTGEEFLTDPISMMILSEGLRTKVIDWPEPFTQVGYHMITFTKPKPKAKPKDDEKDDKKDAKKDAKDEKKEEEPAKPAIEVTFLGSNWPAALKKFDTATKDDASTGIVLHSNLNWQRQSGKKTKSNQYLDALQAVAKFMFSKKSNTGVSLNEDQGKFDMQWHKDKKIEEKMKLIDEQFKGDGGIFHLNVVWHIWMYHPVRGEVTKISNYN